MKSITDKTFFIYLTGVTFGTAAVVSSALYFLPQAHPHAGFAAGTVLLFVCLCTGLYFAGKSAASSSSKLAFNNLVSVSVFGKMLVAVAALFIYQQTAKPENQWFVGIFLFVYIVYTVFEVWFMTKLARQT